MSPPGLDLSEGYETGTSLADFLIQQNDIKAREAAVQASKIAIVKPRAKVPISNLKEEEEDGPLPPPAPEIDFGAINWVGKLTEYRQANPLSIDTLVTEQPVQVPGIHGLRFVCSITIPEAPSNPFGTTPATFTFANKKDAKKYAAKLAIEWLVDNHYMPSADQVKPIKPTAVAPASKTITVLGAPKVKQTIQDGSRSDSSEPSWSRKVRDLAEELGYTPPRYDITQNSSMDSMYSGYAYFGDSATSEGRHGEFSNVYGRKNAKEQCAKELFEFLENIKTHRLSTFGPSGVSMPKHSSKARNRKRNGGDHRKGPYDRVQPRTNCSVIQENNATTTPTWPVTAPVYRPSSYFRHQQETQSQPPYNVTQCTPSSYVGAPHISVPSYGSTVHTLPSHDSYPPSQMYSAPSQAIFGLTYPNKLTASEQAHYHLQQRINLSNSDHNHDAQD